jgi:hypothetical protein
VTHELLLAWDPLKHPRRAYERDAATRPGSKAGSRVGKMKILVKRRGVLGHLG